MPTSPLKFLCRSIRRGMIGIIALSAALLCALRVSASDSVLIRSPGVTQEDIEAYAEAHNLTTLSTSYKLARPGEEASQRLRRLVESAQAAWLSGTITLARTSFKQIAAEALNEDWRQPQRDAIHFAMLRLAQTSPTPLERDEWLEKAAASFSDIEADESLFPPPLITGFKAIRQRVLTQSRTYKPYESFTGFRVMLINGREYETTPDLIIRLPETVFRVTALSDVYPRVSERLTASQLRNFHFSTSPIANGTCDNPTGNGLPEGVTSMTVLYADDCARTRMTSGWIAKGGIAEVERFSERLKKPDLPFSPPPPPAVEKPHWKKPWVWVGLSALVAGSAYVLYREANRSPEIKPVHREGF